VADTREAILKMAEIAVREAEVELATL
jgi:hypothetical protein